MLITQSRIIFSLFFTIAFVFIVSTSFKPYPFSWLVKLSPIVLLILYVAKTTETRAQYYVIVGLCFSALGDFFLDYDRQGLFIFGLGSFFIAHVFYLLALTPFVKKNLTAVGAYLIFGLGIFSLIYTGLGELFLPVLCYMLVLLFMGAATQTSQNTNGYLKLGGLCFVLSDSLISIDKFYQPIEHVTIFIMTSYYCAQYCLAKGFVKSSKV